MTTFYELGKKHARELIEAEQRGYERGLKDARKSLPADLVRNIELDLKAGQKERAIARNRNVGHSQVRTIHKHMMKRFMEGDR